MDESFYTSPPRDVLYRVDSEATKIERFRQMRKASGRMDLEFPDEDAIRIKATMTKRDFQPTQATMQVVRRPPSMARNATRDRSTRRSGARPL